MAEDFDNHCVEIYSLLNCDDRLFKGDSLMGVLRKDISTELYIKTRNCLKVMSEIEQYKSLVVKSLSQKYRGVKPVAGTLIFEYFYLTKKPWCCLEIAIIPDLDFLDSKLVFEKLEGFPKVKDEYADDILKFQQKVYATLYAYTLRNYFFCFFQHSKGINTQLNLDFPLQHVINYFLFPKTETVGQIPNPYLYPEFSFPKLGAYDQEFIYFIVQSYYDNANMKCNIFHIRWKGFNLTYCMDALPESERKEEDLLCKNFCSDPNGRFFKKSVCPELPIRDITTRGRERSIRRRMDSDMSLPTTGSARSNDSISLHCACSCM